MLKKGDTIIVDNTKFVYDGYGVWKMSSDQAQIIDKSGVSANVVKNINTEKYELLVKKINTALRMGTTIDGVQDQIVICVTPLGANTDIQASLTVRELL